MFLPFTLNLSADMVYFIQTKKDDYIASASQVLQAVASYLCMERMVTLRKEKLPIQIDEYITEHFTEKLDAAVLCEHFHIGRTYLYEIAKQNYGVGVAEYIRTLRIEKAKQLLTEQPDLHISEVAFSCGFSDYNYFMTVFKRVAGMSPRQYQNSRSAL